MVVEISVALSTYLANELLDHVLRNNAYTSPGAVYVALFTTMPTVAGGGVEVTGGSYARQASTFTPGAAGVASNTIPLTFSSMPAATIRGAALFDAASGGNMLMFGAFQAATIVAAGTDFSVTLGDVVAVMR